RLLLDARPASGAGDDLGGGRAPRRAVRVDATARRGQRRARCRARRKRPAKAGALGQRRKHHGRSVRGPCASRDRRRGDLGRRRRGPRPLAGAARAQAWGVPLSATAPLRQPGSMEQLRRHNLHLVLRSVYSGAAETRAELAVVTGLTKPTVSTLVQELLADGYLSELGPGRSSVSGGKRPTLLRFEPRARQVIGISVVGRRVLGVISDLAGETSALHVRELEPDEHARDVGERPVRDVVSGLLPQLDAPLLAIGL